MHFSGALGGCSTTREYRASRGEPPYVLVRVIVLGILHLYLRKQYFAIVFWYLCICVSVRPRENTEQAETPSCLQRPRLSRELGFKGGGGV